MEPSNLQTSPLESILSKQMITGGAWNLKTFKSQESILSKQMITGGAWNLKTFKPHP